MNAIYARLASVILGCACFASFPCARAGADDSLADIDAAARSAGNRPHLARALGDAIFTMNWPAQVTKVRVDAAGTHAIAGLVISGVKFHEPLDRASFLDEVAHLVETTFAKSSVEEVDVWTTVPLPTHAHEVVAGDLAMPTSRIVFAVTVKRAEGDAFEPRLRAGRDVYWNTVWAGTLAAR